MLQDLHDRLGRSDRVAVTSVAGLGGVGKSELAVQYARWRLREGDYRGGVVWLAGERSGIELLGFAKAQFFPNQDFSKKGDLPEQLAHCFTYWPAKEVPPESVLLVFDDVTDYQAQVEAILPSDKRFRVLVTTRKRFIEDSQNNAIDYLDLQVLTAAAALAMLQSIIGAKRIATEAATAATLCEWLGYLPLGIKLVGNLLVQEPDWSLAEILRQLRAEKLKHEAMSNVEVAFNVSWQRLTAAACQLAGLLGLFAHNAPIPWNLVEAVVSSCAVPAARRDRKWDKLRRWVLRQPAPEVKTWDILLTPKVMNPARRELVNLSLLERVGEERYQLHPLIREFFAAKLAARAEATAWRTAFAVTLTKIAKTIQPTVTLEQQAQVREAMPHLEAAT
ncbi:MAG: hypothetical protein EA001_00265, partial [Oscillatoriales cyanobacterium]